MTWADYSSEVYRPRGRLIDPDRVVDKGDEFFLQRSGVLGPDSFLAHLSEAVWLPLISRRARIWSIPAYLLSSPHPRVFISYSRSLGHKLTPFPLSPA